MKKYHINNKVVNGNTFLYKLEEETQKFCKGNTSMDFQYELENFITLLEDNYEEVVINNTIFEIK